MPDYETLYPGRFLKKETLAEWKVIRILAVTSVELENDKGKLEDKVTVKYRDAKGEGEIVWPKTNSVLTAVALGERDYQKWVGHLVTIGHDPTVMFGGKRVGGVRVVGSPEMKEPKKVEIKMPRKKRPDVYHLVPTDKKGVALAGTSPVSTPPGAEREPGADDDDVGRGFTDGAGRTSQRT
jgi:hypothetical protein